MSFLDPYIGALKAIVIVAIALGLLWTGHHFGAQGVQGKWDADNLKRANAEKAAILARNAQNAADAAKQKADNGKITKAKDEEIDKLRADLSRAPRLRIGTALCGGPASTAQAASASSSNAADTTGRLVREDVQRDIDALKLKVEEALATGRACQAFVTNNGMAP